ncbi:UNVERIFIED_CONTAM: hypothetical protein Scaly_2890200 [Sesamum calycinum]|uniref:DUF4283 domain-containing protein n=1 Tax=Sesamum calycinum TaxID=2727403 RepID=A0AAW2L952_9LAMI
MGKAKKAGKIVAVIACLESVQPCKKESGQPSAKPPADGQPAPIFSKVLATPKPATTPVSAKVSTNGPEVGTNDFQNFLSGLESSPLFAAKAKHGSRSKNVLPTKDMLSAMEAIAKAGGMMNMPAIAPVLTEKLDQGHRPKGTQPTKETLPIYETLPATEATAGAEGKAQSFAGLFSSNWKLSDENKLTKFADDDRQRVLAGGPYFVYGRPLILKAMLDCFEFKEQSISLTPVWATLPSLPLECWHPNALGKIGSKLDTPIAMHSLTLKMERVSYARILVKVDA